MFCAFPAFQERLLKQFTDISFPGNSVKFLLRVLEMNEATCCKSKVLVHHHASCLAAEAQNPAAFLMLGKPIINTMR